MIFILLIAMMASLFFSRAGLSISMILFTVVSFLHSDIKKQFRYFFSSPVLWSMSVLFIVPLISGLWSSDKQQWLDIMRVKLPLLALPLAFAAPFQLSKKNIEWLQYIFILLVICGTLWSMFHYVSNMEAVNEGYLRAKSLVTPVENDHIRFSWMVSIAVLLAGWQYWQKRKEKNSIAYLFLFVAVWLVVFLHILAARTGLFSFYIMLVITAFVLALKTKKINYSAALLVVIIALPVLAWFTLPSFHNRVRYFLYDYEYFRKTQYLQGANDANRVISLKAGWNVLQQNPLHGVGFGDIKASAEGWMDEHYPGMLESDKFYTSSEWLVYGAGCGWPGVLLFTFIMLTPFFAAVKNKLAWWCVNGTAAFSFLFDVGLEVQFGVFLYAFIVLCFWKCLRI